jgi:hypothetical protein
MLDVSTTLPVRAMPEAISSYEAAGFHVQAYHGSFAFVSTPVLQAIMPGAADNGRALLALTVDATRWAGHDGFTDTL